MQYSQEYLKQNPLINIDDFISLKDAFKDIKNSHIKEVASCYAKGKVSYDQNLKTVFVDCDVKVELIVVCAMSLQPFLWQHQWQWIDDYSYDSFNLHSNFINEDLFNFDKYLSDEIFSITPINLVAKDVKIINEGKNWRIISVEDADDWSQGDARWMPLTKIDFENNKEEK